MEPIQTQEQLLVRLTGNGDPSAFYTLIAPLANAAYIAERNSGKRHSETLSALLPSFKKMFQNYISGPVQSDFKAWYKEQENKYLSASQEVAIESLNEAGFKNLLTADIVHFDWALNLILQRHYGKFRRAKKHGAALRSIALFKRGRWFFKTALFTGLAGFLLVAIYIYLILSKTQFTVSFRSAQATQTMVFPSTTHNLFRVNPVAHPNAIAQENPPSATPSPQSLLLHDTIKVHDTVRIVNRPKPPGSGSSSLNSGALPSISKNPQPFPPAASTIKTANGGKSSISSTINKTNPPTNPTTKKLPLDSLR